MAEVIRKVRPTPSDEYLGNPHKGCCTFQHFAGDSLFPGTRWSEEGPLQFPPPVEAARSPFEPKAPKGFLPSTVAYCRWFWRVMEPRKGQYDFSMIEKSLETCAQRGQTLAIRLMAFGSVNQPAVPDWYAEKYPMQTQERGHGEIRHPVHDSPEYLEHWGALIREAGKRFDGHPLLETVDLAYIGPWGEGDGECSGARRREFTQLWKQAFPHTHRLVQCAGNQLAEGIATGTGWRCDFFGDLSRVGSPTVPKHVSWNHMFDCYPREVYLSGAADVWKTAPVHFECCPMHWYNAGWDVDFIIDQGLKYHGTYFQPLYTALPEVWIDKLAAFCRRLGYRFVFRQASFDVSVANRGAFRFQCWIENVGVAPIYRRYDFALRLRQGDNEKIIPMSDVDVRTWLPGDIWLDRQVTIPAGFEKGWAELAAGLIDPQTQAAKVNFAVKERFSDGWVWLDGIQLR